MMQASSHNKKARLLVVDDEPDLRLLYAMTLEKEGRLEKPWRCFRGTPMTLSSPTCGFLMAKDLTC
jgi:CheY-like chemotaxis protein